MARIERTERAVVIDGGGIKGGLSSTLLGRIEAAAPFLGSVTRFGGTSTGGIVALGLAAGLAPGQLVQLYRDHGAKIFSSRGVSDTLAGGIDELIRANYGQDGLREALRSTFGDMKLKQLHVDVLIPAFDLRLWKPKFFDRSHDGDMLVVDVALATSAAPTYFPAHMGFADGGIFANNPSDCMIAHLRRQGVRTQDMRMLSIGSGSYRDWAPDELSASAAADWGFAQWVVSKPHRLLGALFDGSVLASHERSRLDLGENYHRVQPTLPGPCALDDVSMLPALELVATGHDLDETIAWVKSRWS